jgi:hypothetical protein
MFLDHGVDEASCERLRLKEHGMTFDSPWEFPVMAELSICLDYAHPRLGRRRTPMEGVVVGSRRLRGGAYETSVLFFGMDESRVPAMEMAEVMGD